MLLLALGLGGCGELSGGSERASAPSTPEGAWGPSEPGQGARPRPVAPPHRAPSAGVASALEAGTVGVVGIKGAVGVRPSTLDVATDAALEDLRWDRWDARGAEGSGTLSVRDCDPNCASGGKDDYPARVRLSAPRLCGGEAYFDRARVDLDGAPAPASYVRAPC